MSQSASESQRKITRGGAGDLLHLIHENDKDEMAREIQ